MHWGIRVGLAFLVSACASAMVARGRVEDGATLAGHASYEFGAAEGAPAGFAGQSVASGVVALARGHVDEELTGRGYHKAPGGDLVVRISNGRRVVTEETHVAAGAGDGVEFDETQAALVIDVFDRASNRRLYHSIAHDVVEAEKIDDEQLKEAVHRMLAALPAQ